MAVGLTTLSYASALGQAISTPDDSTTSQPLMGWLAGVLITLIITILRRHWLTKSGQRRVRSRL
jgi:hypothetical protein